MFMVFMYPNDQAIYIYICMCVFALNTIYIYPFNYFM